MTLVPCSLEFQKAPLIQQPRFKWFAAESEEAESWLGEHDTMDQAVDAGVREAGPEWLAKWPNAKFLGVSVAQGKKVPKAERENPDQDYVVRADMAVRILVRREMVEETLKRNPVANP